MNQHIKGTLAVLGSLVGVAIAVGLATIGILHYVIAGITIGAIGVGILASIYEWGMKLGNSEPEEDRFTAARLRNFDNPLAARYNPRRPPAGVVSDPGIQIVDRPPPKDPSGKRKRWLKNIPNPMKAPEKNDEI